MTDRELLELAAKAAGYVRMIYRDDTPYVSSVMNGDDFFAWNPLTDDGDALRLAVKLSVFAGEACMIVCGKVGTDPCADIRRLIVRAAAEVGKERSGAV